MSRQANILSFDEAKRDVRSPRPVDASRGKAPSRRATRSSGGVPEFDSPFRQAPSHGATSAVSRTRSTSTRRPASRFSDDAYLASSPYSRASTARHAAPSDAFAPRPRTGAHARPSASDPWDLGFKPSSRSAAFGSAADDLGGWDALGDEYDEDLDDPRASKRPSRMEAWKKSRAKSKAERKFSKQFGGSNAAADAQGGPRAAVYKGEMGAKHRQAARMQNEASAKRGVSFGSLVAFKSSPKLIASAAVAACLVLSCLFLYPAAQQYYHAVREHDRLAAEYAAVEERNDAIEGHVASLQTDSGVENKAHEQFGWVKEGEETANVRGLDPTDEESTFRANIPPGSVEAPETWYSPFLDALFGVE